MRVLAACLASVLGLGALATIAACSDATDSGSAGAGGASSAGSGGRASSAGASSSAGTGGGAECKFLSDACQGCLVIDSCGTQLQACTKDATCAPAIEPLTNCACGSTMTADQCQAAFLTAGGSKAEQLVNCYSLNCEDECQ